MNEWEYSIEIKQNLDFKEHLEVRNKNCDSELTIIFEFLNDYSS